MQFCWYAVGQSYLYNAMDDRFAMHNPPPVTYGDQTRLLLTYRTFQLAFSLTLFASTTWVHDTLKAVIQVFVHKK